MKKITSVLCILFTIISLTACSNESKPTTNGNGRIYKCDYKTMNINTKITTTLNNETITISGKLFTLVTDPLTVKNSKGEKIAYAGDAYGFISQDDHGIYIGDTFDINMCGNIEFFGDSYTLKNENGETVATAEFNSSNTKGTIVDTNNNIIATYASSLLANDYTVTIYDNNVCSDLSILMITASYVSDYKADKK